jgi:membrane-bound lytic murein transglycosylase A
MTPTRPRLGAVLAVVLLAACDTLAPKPAPVEPPAPAPATPVPSPAPAPTPAPEAKPVPAYRAADWNALPGWRQDRVDQAWDALLRSCGVLARQPAWETVCTTARALDAPDEATVRRFFEERLRPWQVLNPDGSDNGLITGYYEPLLFGSRSPSTRYRHPVYGVPDDLLVIDLGNLHPDLKNLRLRGRLDGRRVVPYYDRAQIERGDTPMDRKVLLWVDDAVELFFLQIQGSGRVRLDSGETVAIGYADQNGHPYRSIGRLLIDRGDLPLEQTSMQGIKAWARRNPDRLQELLNHNASYVFFRELPPGLPGPPGALGVPLSARRSLAVDPRFVPLGAPVFLATTWPNTKQPLNRLMLAQDTGGAIRGAVRADFFWGFGDDAPAQAGRMKQSGRMWVMLPADYPLPEGSVRE